MKTKPQSLRLVALASASLLLCLLAACTGGNGTASDASRDSDSVAAAPQQTPTPPRRDREAVGTVGDGTSMHVLELVTDSLDTLYLETSSIVVSGGLVCGNRVNVIYHRDAEGLTATAATNTTALEHLWTRRAANGHTQSLEIDAGGRAATYDMPTAYSTWRLHGGQLLLSTPRQAGVEQSGYTDTFDIMLLNADSLVIAGAHGLQHYWREN